MTLGLGDAMGDVAEGAATAAVLNAAARQLTRAEDIAMSWQRHAENLDAQLQATRAQLQTSLESNLELQNEVARLTKALEQQKTRLSGSMETGAALTTYGRELKQRLRQMEKALRHSSADAMALKAVLEPYQALVERMNLQGDLPTGLKERADAVWTKFQNGDILTDDPDIVAILEEAPVPKASEVVKCLIP